MRWRYSRWNSDAEGGGGGRDRDRGRRGHHRKAAGGVPGVDDGAVQTTPVPRAVDATASSTLPELLLVANSHNSSNIRTKIKPKRIKSPIRKLIPIQVVPVAEDDARDDNDETMRSQYQYDEGVEAVCNGARSTTIVVVDSSSANRGGGTGSNHKVFTSRTAGRLSPLGSVQDVLSSLQSTIQSLRSRDDDDEDRRSVDDDERQGYDGIHDNAAAASGWEVSSVLTKEALDELLVLRSIEDETTHPQDGARDAAAVASTTPKSIQSSKRMVVNHWTRPSDPRRGLRQHHQQRGGIITPKKKRHDGDKLSSPVRVHPVQPCIPDAVEGPKVSKPASRMVKDQQPAQADTNRSLALTATAAGSPRGPVVKILPFVERPTKLKKMLLWQRQAPAGPDGGSPHIRSSYDLPSLLSASVHESKSEDNLYYAHQQQNGQERQGARERRVGATDARPDMLLCTALGAPTNLQCVAAAASADPKDAKTGAAAASNLLRCHGNDDAATGSATGESGSTTAATASSSDGDNDDNNSRPRIVSFETNQFGTTSGSVVSIIGTASTVTSVDGDEDDGEAIVEIDSMTTPSGSSASSSTVPSAYKEDPQASNARSSTNIVDRVRDASCQPHRASSGTSTSHNGTQEGSESDANSTSGSDDSSSSSSSSGMGRRCGPPSHEDEYEDEYDDVATLDEALQSGRRWLW